MISQNNNQDLTQERDLLNEMFEHSPNFIAVVTGKDFVFERANEKYFKLVGHRDIIGKPVMEALPEIKGQGFDKLLEGVFNTGINYVGTEIPITFQHIPGGPVEERFLDFMYQRMNHPDGSPRGIFVHGVDVTEKVIARRKIESSEKMFRTFADSMPDMAFVADAEGNITFFNRQWYEYIGAIEGTEGWGWKETPIQNLKVT